MNNGIFYFSTRLLLSRKSVEAVLCEVNSAAVPTMILGFLNSTLPIIRTETGGGGHKITYLGE